VPKEVEEIDEAGKDIKTNLLVMGITFLISGGWSLIVHFVPILGTFPLFSYCGAPDLTKFGWVIGTDVSYCGMGMIMGHRVAWSTLLGAFIAYAVIAPIVSSNGFAPGPKPISHGDPDNAYTWLLWPCVALMIGDAVASFCILLGKMGYALVVNAKKRGNDPQGTALSCAPADTIKQQTSLSSNADSDASRQQQPLLRRSDSFDPAPPSERVPLSWWSIGLLLTIILCVLLQSLMFREAGVLWWQVLIATILALFIAVLAIRALGETDMNPTSGIGKLAQLIIAAVAPGNIVMNLVAGAIAEAAAMSAGDMSQDLKTGHLLGTSPRSQFFAMGIGSLIGVFASIAAYMLYRPLIGTEELQAPVATVWLTFAQGLMETGLPTGVVPYIILFFLLGVLLSAVYNFFPPTPQRVWPNFIPSGIGIAIGMYVDPKYSILRWIGSVALLIWQAIDSTSKRKFYIAAASGLVLGHGILSIIEALLSLGGITAGNVGSCVGCSGIEYFSCGGGC